MRIADDIARIFLRRQGSVGGLLIEVIGLERFFEFAFAPHLDAGQGECQAELEVLEPSGQAQLKELRKLVEAHGVVFVDRGDVGHALVEPFGIGVERRADFHVSINRKGRKPYRPMFI